MSIEDDLYFAQQELYQTLDMYYDLKKKLAQAEAELAKMRQERNAWKDAAIELADIVDGVINMECDMDSFTTQPIRILLEGGENECKST